MNSSTLLCVVVAMSAVGCNPKKGYKAKPLNNQATTQKKSVVEIKPQPQPPAEQAPEQKVEAPAPAATTAESETEIILSPPPQKPPTEPAKLPDSPQVQAAPKPATAPAEEEVGEKIKKASAEAMANLEKKVADAEKKESVFASEDERAKWIKLTEYVAEYGIPTEAVSGLFLTVTDMSTKKPKEANNIHQFSIVGGMDSKTGTFTFKRVQVAYTTVSYSSTGEMTKDEWSILLTRDAQLGDFMHVIHFEDNAGHHLKTENQKPTVAEAEAKSAELRKYWLQRLDIKEKKEEDIAEKKRYEEFMEKLNKKK